LTELKGKRKAGREALMGSSPPFHVGIGIIRTHCFSADGGVVSQSFPKVKILRCKNLEQKAFERGWVEAVSYGLRSKTAGKCLFFNSRMVKEGL
jgi:hypothetical protein